MKTLAELSFEYIWLLLFGSEEIIDLDYSVKAQESLSQYFDTMTRQERDALAQVAREAQARLLADPDEHGYTPKSLITNEQKAFLAALASGDIFEHGL